jgi:hypothetical protein
MSRGIKVSPFDKDQVAMRAVVDLCAAVYGSSIAALFVLFYNLRPRVASVLAGRKTATP